MASTYCRSCGYRLPQSSARYCPVCGGIQDISSLNLTQTTYAHCVFCGFWHVAHGVDERFTASPEERLGPGVAKFCSSCGRAIPRDDPSEKRYCTYCGRRAANREARFCRKCGRNLDSQRDYE